MSHNNKPFWERKSFTEFNASEWEAVCDGCARCCLNKIEDEDSGELFYTNVACYLLTEQCHCSDYTHRTSRVPDCLQLTPTNVPTINWLPKTCAYRRLAEGRGLAAWHPLVSGDAHSVHEAGVSIQNKYILENYIYPDDLPNFIVDWIDDDIA